MSTRRRSDDDFSREIDAHLAHAEDELLAEGCQPDEARLEARRRFGNITAARERFHESRRWIGLDRFRQDVRMAIRGIRRYPVGALVAVLSLAVGIGAATITLTVRNVLFHHPPPLYQQPQQLSRVQVGTRDEPIRPSGNDVPGAPFAIWQDALGPSIAGATTAREIPEVRSSKGARPFPVRRFTPGLFGLLGVKPVLGGTEGAVLSYRAWQLLFDGRDDAIGQTIWAGGRSYAVSGVLPTRFWFSEMTSPIWLPLDRPAIAAQTAIAIVVRRPPGTTPGQLASSLQSSLQIYAQQQPASQRPMRLKVSSINGTPTGRAMSMLLPYVLSVSVLLVLLIAIANVAILIMAQWTIREHELAIRASLGASRGRLVRALLSESLLLAVVGGLLGGVATYALRSVLLQHAGTFVGFFDLSIGWVVLAEVAGITVASGLAIGLAPALYETRRLHASPSHALAASDNARQAWRHALVILEITLTVALLVETGSMLSAYQRQEAGELGFATRPIVIVKVENARGVPLTATLDALRTLPAIDSASAATAAPYAGFGRLVHVAGEVTRSRRVAAEQIGVTPEFFRTLRVPLRAGRQLAALDSAASHVAVINETLARRSFADRNPVGSQVWVGTTSYRVVGVVADYLDTSLQPHQLDAKIFLPLDVHPKPLKDVVVVVRATGDPAALVQTLRRATGDASPGNVVHSLYTLDQIREIAGEEMLVGTVPLIALIIIGLLLTMAGIYGVLAFSIARRSRELAVRIAVGATGRDLVTLVVGHTVRLVSIGATLGIALTFALSRIVRAGGGAGSIYDPPAVAFLMPVLVLAVVAALATWLPSRRALRVNPADVLRTT